MRAIFWLSSLALLLWPAWQTSAQTRSDRSGNRVERTREFLGLGKAPDPVAAERGSLLYRRNCAFCHGAKATGAEGPDLVRSGLVLHDDDGNEIGTLLLKGRAERGMPAFPSFGKDEIRDISAFLHQRVELAANRGTYNLQDIVTGNAAAGKEYFNGKGKCSQCHSPSGDLSHIGSKYQPPDLQAAFLYPAAVSRGARSEKATVTLPSGEKLTGTLAAIDDFELTLIDEDGKYHFWPRSGDLKLEISDPLRQHRELLAHYTNADMHNLLSYLVTLK